MRFGRTVEREPALDILSDFVSGVDHDAWRPKSERRRVMRAFEALANTRTRLKPHETGLLRDTLAQIAADEEQVAWERMGGAT